MKNIGWSTKSSLIILILILLIGVGVAWRSQIIAQSGPVWRQIVVGVSTKEIVFEQLGKPDETVNRFMATEYHYWDTTSTLAPHRIIVSKNEVEQIVVNPLQFDERILLGEIIEVYGEPRTVNWSRTSPGHRAIAYPEMGVFIDVVALPIEEAIVTRIIYFLPRTRLRYYVDFRNRISHTDPFPDSDIVGSKDPWFGTSEEAR